MTTAYDLFASLKPKLQAIRTANGYLTDAGRVVYMGPVPQVDFEQCPLIRAYEISAIFESVPGYAPQGKAAVSFLVEGYAKYTDDAEIMATGHNLVADIQKALFGDAERDLSGATIRVNPEGYQILPPEPGSSIVVAQVRGNYTFVNKFQQPAG
jgi:hypothetical protein